MERPDLVYHDGKPMLTDVTKKLFTTDEFHRMAEAGIFFDDNDRVELIDGEIIKMSPIGARHMECVDRATTFFTEAFGRRAIVSVQSSLALTKDTEPQPDIVILKPRPDFYRSKRRSPEDVLLMVEVSDTTLRYDQNVKLPRYAAAGISEVWIEDLTHNLLLVYREPAGDHFKTELTFRHGDSVSPLAFPETIFKVDDLLG